MYTLLLRNLKELEKFNCRLNYGILTPVEVVSINKHLDVVISSNSQKVLLNHMFT